MKLVNQRPLNSLDKRILRMVMYLIKKDQEMRQISGFTFLCDRTQSFIFRCISLIIVVTCVGICLYQTTKRFMLYKEVPTAVDVDIREEESLLFPATTVCTVMTDGITKLLKSGNRTQSTCYNVYPTLVSGVIPGLNVTYIWKMGDISKAATGSIQSKKVAIEELEKSNKEVTMFGTCATFSSSTPYAFRGPDLKLVVEIRNQEVGCRLPTILGSAHLPDEHFNIRNMWFVKRNSEFSLSHSVTQYIFLDHWKRPCMSREAFFQCVANCKKDIWGKFPCKFPFYPEEVNLPWCPLSRETSNIFPAATLTFLQTNPAVDCNCNRLCVITQREELRMFLASDSGSNSTIITMHYDSNLVNVMTERIAYDVISFLSDVGGNTGLYLGLSLLSVFELAYKIAYLLYSASLKPKFSHSDPIFKKVLTVYHKCTRKGNSLKFWNHTHKINNYDSGSDIREDVSIKNKKNRCNGFVELMRYVSLIIGFVFCVGLCVERIMYYTKRPIYMTVDVIENKTLAFPTLTLCWPSKAIISARKKKAEILKVDYCDIHYLDLLDYKLDAMHLWNISDNKYEFIDLSFLGKLYYNTPGEDTDVTSYELLPANCSIETSFVAKKQIKDSTIAPCAYLEEAERCKRNCLRRRLSTISCRLPYMMLIENLPLCSTPATAKKSRAVYQEVLHTTDENKDCQCLRKCSNIGYNARVFVTRTQSGFTTLTFTFRHPYIETVREVSAYVMEKLFCDIGSILGITMGLSVYSVSVLVTSIYHRILGRHGQ